MELLVAVAGLMNEMAVVLVTVFAVCLVWDVCFVWKTNLKMELGMKFSCPQGGCVRWGWDVGLCLLELKMEEHDNDNEIFIYTEMKRKELLCVCVHELWTWILNICLMFFVHKILNFFVIFYKIFLGHFFKFKKQNKKILAGQKDFNIFSKFQTEKIKIFLKLFFIFLNRKKYSYKPEKFQTEKIKIFLNQFQILNYFRLFFQILNNFWIFELYFFAEDIMLCLRGVGFEQMLICFLK